MLKNRRVCGEKGDADLEGAQRFESIMWGIVYEEELSYDAIYNADESGLIYRKEPTTTYDHPEEKSAAGICFEIHEISKCACDPCRK